VLFLNSLLGVFQLLCAAVIALAATRGLPIDEAIEESETLQTQRAVMVSIGTPLYLSGEATRIGLFVTFTVQLFRRRASAIWLLIAFLLVDVATNLSWSRIAPAYWAFDPLRDAIRYGLCGAVLAYSYHLQRRGVLTKGKPDLGSA
jgi:hypothetical protein